MVLTVQVCGRILTLESSGVILTAHKRGKIVTDVSGCEIATRGEIVVIADVRAVG